MIDMMKRARAIATGARIGDALALVEELGGYDRKEYLQRYQAFMLRPGEHRDTYVEECHRGFFENLKRGVNAGRAAVRDKHIGGMVAVVPLYTRLRAAGEARGVAAEAVQKHVSVTHAGSIVEAAVTTLTRIAEELWSALEAGDSGAQLLTASLEAHLERQDLEYLRGPISRLAACEPPHTVIGRYYSPACYLDGAMPAIFYLTLRYAERPSEGLIENVMVGGDNCGRGAVLGALLGLAGGLESFPQQWMEGLVGRTVQGTPTISDASAE